MAIRELMRVDLLDRLHGCWLGQQIGATLGAPLEGRAYPAALRFYDPIPGQASASQELDFQLAWLDLLRRKGPGITSDDLAEQWEKHVGYSYDELGWAAWNLRRDLRPPLSGAFNNPFKHGSAGMGRALFWSMAAPGAPQTAVELAWQDAILDHSEEGLWAAMFWAAVGSAAFLVRDPGDLLEIGLAMIPQGCRTAGAVRAARDRYRISQTPLQMREAVLNASSSQNYTDAPQNSGFIALGLLYGKGDFGTTVTTAVNCGLNARVNGALAGGIAGIVGGRISIPKEWADPIGDIVIYGWGLRDMEVDRKTPDLAARTLQVAETVLLSRGTEIVVTDGASGETVAPPSAPSVPVVSSASPAASGTGTASMLGDRARFLEIDPAPPVAAPSAEPPADAIETEPALAPPAERAEISDSATIAEPLPSDVAQPDEPPIAIEAPGKVADAAPTALSADSAAPSTEATPTPATDAPAGEGPAIEPSPEGGAAETAAPADGAPDSAADLADIFEPSAVPVVTQPTSPIADLRVNDRAKELLVKSPSTGVCHVGNFQFTTDYGEKGPVLLPGVATNFTVEIRNLGEADFIGSVTLSTPQGWQVAVPGAQAQRQMIASGRMARFGFVVRAPETAQLTGVNNVQIVMTPANETPVTCDLTFLGGSCWWITGPFANRDDEGYDKTFEVEDKSGRENQYLGRGGSMVAWQRLAMKDNIYDELEPFFGGFGGVAYATTTLHFPVQTDARLVIHSTDGVHVWLNGQRIFRRHAHEPFRPTVSQSRNMVDVTFKPGANLVMLKIVRCKEPLQFAFVVTDRNGIPLEDLGNTKWEV